MGLITRAAFMEGEKGHLRKQFCADIKLKKEADDDSRVIPFVITTSSKDRDGDTLSGKGWLTKSWEQNPVVLWAHDQRSLPVAKGFDLKTLSDGLSSKAQFATKDEYDFADTVYKLLLGGYLKAVSVGFDPVEFKRRESADDWGIDFLKQELLEFSVVPVPSNRDALRMAKGSGIDISAIHKWAETVLDHSDELVIMDMTGCSKKIIEAARKEADPKQRLSVIMKGFLPIGGSTIKNNLKSKLKKKQKAEGEENTGDTPEENVDESTADDNADNSMDALNEAVTQVTDTINQFNEGLMEAIEVINNVIPPAEGDPVVNDDAKAEGDEEEDDPDAEKSFDAEEMKLIEEVIKEMAG